jgi:hypothetical protein
MNTKHESMMGILRLYELRREETMRKARAWFATFNPTSAQDVLATLTGDESAYYRMVTSYWEMAASFVNHGAIDEQMFNDATLEHVSVYAKIEPFITEIRAMAQAPQYLLQLEQLVMRYPQIGAILAHTRERLGAAAAQRGATPEVV